MNVAEFCEPTRKPDSVSNRVASCEDSALKVEINNIIWMFSPETLTLKEADELSITILDLVKSGGRRHVSAAEFAKFQEMKAAVAAEENGTNERNQ